ncbi:unnamed protein product [Closterium sp. NIES-65]|nr:unnamed protein product [Closterium sp. NIES-65]
MTQMGHSKAAAAAWVVVAILLGTSQPSTLPSNLSRVRPQAFTPPPHDSARVEFRACTIQSSASQRHGMRHRCSCGGVNRIRDSVPTSRSFPMGANAAAASDVVPAEVRVGTVVLAGSLAQPEPVYFDQNRCVTAPEIAGGKADVLVWWDVFSERTITFKMGASVKSIRCVLDNICRKAKCPKNSTCIKTKDSQEPASHLASGVPLVCWDPLQNPLSAPEAL